MIGCNGMRRPRTDSLELTHCYPAQHLLYDKNLRHVDRPGPDRTFHWYDVMDLGCPPTSEGRLDELAPLVTTSRVPPTPSFSVGDTAMPTTVNGVGTHYYGKSNRSVRTAACHSCHRVANLESYDTRLWFVVIFIPIIPLGRKRIIDQCPRCRRHFAADADTYEQSKQLQVSGSLDEYRRSASPESALKAHGQLLGFRDFVQAGEFRRNALERFPDHAGLLGGLAAPARALRQLRAGAGAVQPGLGPGARHAGGTHRGSTLEDGCGRSGRCRTATSLISWRVPEPGSSTHWARSTRLAGSFQRWGRHSEALELAGHLLQELPKIGQRHAFRRVRPEIGKGAGLRDRRSCPRSNAG